MEQSIVSMKGIVIEKLTIGWLQLLMAAFTLGGFAYASSTTYTKVVEVEAKQKAQEAVVAKYVPIIDKIDVEGRTQGDSINKLTDTITLLNNNISVIIALRQKEEDDKVKIEKRLDKMADEITELKVMVGAIPTKTKP